eukprot:TRINITY_DN35637_c0_g1_i1.p1 TRINITY_DN35637_c0_g1~~TRINITY_DN35637_c0_g1_i1.p1  ORF type:complete len:721 (+),score=232.17 TRINITY_DN35637_c0_g1_i1:109-2271(+)
MVRFGDYFASVTAHKPQWAKAFLDYRGLVAVLEGDVDGMCTSIFSGFAPHVSPSQSSGITAGTAGSDQASVIRVGTQLRGFDDDERPAVRDTLLDHAPACCDIRRIDSADSLDAVVSTTAHGGITTHLFSPHGDTEMGDADTQPLCVSCDDTKEQRRPLVRPPSDYVARPSRRTVHSVDPEFCEAFREEFEKVLLFTKRAHQCFNSFFEVKKERWVTRIQQGINVERVRRNVVDLYHEVCHLAHFVDVNIVAIHKLLKKAKKHLPEDRRIKPASVLGSGDKRLNKDDVESLKREVEAFYCREFARGDMHKTMLQLQGGPEWGLPLFSIGLLLGLFIAGLLYGMHVTLELDVPDQDVHMWWRVLPCFRIFLFMALCSVMWAADLFVYRRFRINHVYILELLDFGSTQMHWVHSLVIGLSGLFTWVWLADLYLRSGIDPKYYYHGFEKFQGWCLPVMLVCFVILYGFHWEKLRDVVKTAVNVFVLPYPRSVRFRDFFLADWFTSLTLLFADLEYLGCYLYESLRSGSAAEHENSCPPHNADYKYFLTCLPFLWRLSQCLHMYNRTRRKAHLINAGKYVALVLPDVIPLFFLAATGKTSGAHWHKFWAYSIAKTYAFAWDIMMDWGFAGHAGVPGFNRRKTTFKKPVYLAAGLYNLLARFAYIIPYLPGWPGGEVLDTTLAIVELSRRASWSVFRMENENVNNLEKYRSVDYVPEVDANDYGM